MKVKSWLSFWFFLGVFLVFMGFLYTYYNTHRIKKGSHEVLCVEIINQRMFRGGIFIRVKFSYQNKSYESERSITTESYNQYENGKRNILIVFPKGEPEIHYILESKKDFEKFGIIPQDTVSITCSDKIQNW